MARRELEPGDVTAVIDTREQTPFDLSPLRSVPGSLTTGDYTVVGLEDEIAVERKSLPDLVACCGRERDRFEAEVRRLLAFPSRLLIIEATWGAIELGQWRGKVTPATVTGSLLGWAAMGLPICTVLGHAEAGKYAARFLFIAARRRWRALQGFLPALKIEGAS
jgi:DNA excision repair protein ERCC-4